MRIAFISDIHGNFTALQAVVTDIKQQGIDQVVSLGDTVTLGPQPKEVLDTLKELKSINVKGNHDEAILAPEHASQFEITEHLVPDLYWGRERLTESDLEFIRSFKLTYEVSFPNGIRALAFHGSPLKPTDIILSTTPAETLDAYFNGLTAGVYIGGHSHIQMHRRHGKKLIINSGSVGNAFIHPYSPGNVPKLLPWAEYAVISQSGESLDVDLRRVSFDTNTLLETIKTSGLPGTEWWLQQYQNE